MPDYDSWQRGRLHAVGPPLLQHWHVWRDKQHLEETQALHHRFLLHACQLTYKAIDACWRVCGVAVHAAVVQS